MSRVRNRVGARGPFLPCLRRKVANARCRSPRFASPLTYTPQHLAERILTSRSALEGEHKRLTVLFCDIANSTPLAERLGEESMYDLLNRFFEHALEEVHRYEGTINQFLGDGFMALFGAPLALEHHERHAVLAGLGLRRRLAEHLQAASRSAGMAFEVRLGVNTGLVVVGKIGDNLRMDYTAVGDTTNVAARLQAAAAPGEMLISAATFERVRAVVDTQPLGRMEVKGRSAALEVYRVVGARAAMSIMETGGARPLSRFVGRDREIADLTEALEHAKSGRGQAIGIVSEPGMGKTRLLREFREHVAGRDVSFLEGHCLSYGSAIPYLPILDILRATCRMAESDTPDTAVAKVRAAVAGAGMDAEASASYLLHLLGLKEETGPLASLTAETIQSRTFETLRQLCLRGSRRRPLVFIIEDLHWVDRTSEDFIALMAESLAGVAILFIATYRPGYSPAWINKSYATQIALRSLSENGGLAIVRDLLRGKEASEPLAREIVARGEGNPLFLEELARAVGERGGAAATVPETLQDVLAARIDRLPEDTKRLLQLASVIGREFSQPLLARVWERRRLARDGAAPADPARIHL